MYSLLEPKIFRFFCLGLNVQLLTKPLEAFHLCLPKPGLLRDLKRLWTQSQGWLVLREPGTFFYAGGN